MGGYPVYVVVAVATRAVAGNVSADADHRREPHRLVDRARFAVPSASVAGPIGPTAGEHRDGLSASGLDARLPLIGGIRSAIDNGDDGVPIAAVDEKQLGLWGCQASSTLNEGVSE